MIILDTKVISEPLKPSPDPAVIRWLDRHSPATLYVTTISALRITMKLPLPFALTTVFSVLYFFAYGALAGEARHSLESDYGFMIGRWSCHVTQAGTPDQQIIAEFEWAHDKHVLRENMRLKDTVIGEFLTTYDKTTDRFKGVGVGAWGYVVWENAGFDEGRLSERGFIFDGGKMTPVSRSEFERLSDTHYLVHDFEADTADGRGKATDTEDCVKVK